MARGNGNTSFEQQVLDELRLVREELGAFRSEFNARLDKIIENTGAHWRGLDTRVATVETKLGLK